MIIVFCFLLFLNGIYLAIMHRNYQKKSEEFLQLSAHELRSYICVMQGFLELLQQKEIPLEKKESIQSKLYATTVNMEKKLEGLLLLKKRKNLTKEVCSVGNLLQKIHREFRLRYPSQTLYIKNDTSLKNITVHQELFFLALLNLISNAIKHGRQPIVLKIEEQKKKILFSVVDGGECNTPCKRLLLKKGYFAQTKQGYGLGLYLVQAIVKKHQGDIFFSSSPKTSFTIALKKA